MKVTVVEYGRFTLKAGMMGGKGVARAFLRESPSGDVVGEAEGKTPEAALETLKADLDAEDARRRGQRRTDGAFAVPTEDEFRDALKAVRLSAAQMRMLLEHAKSGHAGMTATDLASVAGYKDLGGANMQYGLAAREIGDAIGIDAPPAAARDGDVATGILASAGAPTEDGHFVWVMHPELREALLKTDV